MHALRGDASPWAQQSAYVGAVAYGNFLLQAFKSSTLQKTMKAKTKDGYKSWYFEQDNPIYFLDDEQV